MDPQLKASLERVLTIYATYFIMKYGNRIPGFDSSIVPDILVIGGSGLSAAWGAYINRKANLVAVAATAIPSAKILLDPRNPDTAAIAEVTPGNVTVDPSK
jgi:hypothetical protein